MFATRLPMAIIGPLVMSALAIPQQSFAQPAPTTLQFEVASIKEAASGPDGNRGGCHGTNSVYPLSQQAAAPPLGRCVIVNARLSHLISTAYGIPLTNLKTGPDWIQRGDLRFNVEALAGDPSNVTEQQLLIMLQNLLVERFQLKFHMETSEVSGSALTIAKDGSKLKPSQGDERAVMFTGSGGQTLPKPLQGEPVTMTARKFSISTLTGVLAVLGNGPVLDKTGLTGEYDFTLSWDENAGPALSTALREQLGLKMDAAKIPSSTFVVDSAQKPTPN